MMRKLRLFLLLSIACFVSGQATYPQTRSSKKPNIILILADDLGYGDLGSYGQSSVRTPNLDQLAEEGTRFLDAYASAPVCAPSRASLMTGLHQGHAYIRGNNDKSGSRVSLRPGDLTMAEMLKRAGYRTGIIGKWGLGEPDTTGVPTKKGFDYFYGYLNQNLAHNYYPPSLWRNEEKIELGGKSYSPDLFGRETLDFIRREKDHPFFLYLAYTLPHANNELRRKTNNGMETPTDAPYTNENWSQPNKNFAAMVTRLDGQVGDVMRLLKELGLEENTILIFSGDNGPQGVDEGNYNAKFFNSTGPLRGLKRQLYEGGIREPMIIRWPGKIAAGRTNDFPWVHFDLFPTFAAIAGAPLPRGLDGISVLPVWLGHAAPRRSSLYWEFHEGGFVQAVRFGKWKGIKRHGSPHVELYDLDSDIGETRDVAADHPSKVAQIAAIMRREHRVSPIWGDDDK